MEDGYAGSNTGLLRIIRERKDKAEEEGLASREGLKRIRKARKEKDPNAALLSLQELNGQIERFLKPGNKVAQGRDI